MSTDTMNSAEAAAEIGRTEAWLLRHREALEKKQLFPKPLLPTAPYFWSRAQIAAWKDRGLPPKFREAAAAHRAALEAYQGVLAGGGETSRVIDDRSILDQEFGL